MNDKAPVSVGMKFKSMRNSNVATVERVKHFGTELGWSAFVRIGKRGRWVTCSKDGIKGYRRVS